MPIVKPASMKGMTMQEAQLQGILPTRPPQLDDPTDEALLYKAGWDTNMEWLLENGDRMNSDEWERFLQGLARLNSKAKGSFTQHTLAKRLRKGPVDPMLFVVARNTWEQAAICTPSIAANLRANFGDESIWDHKWFGPRTITRCSNHMDAIFPASFGLSSQVNNKRKSQHTTGDDKHNDHDHGKASSPQGSPAHGSDAPVNSESVGRTQRSKKRRGAMTEKTSAEDNYRISRLEKELCRYKAEFDRFQGQAREAFNHLLQEQAQLHEATRSIMATMYEPDDCVVRNLTEGYEDMRCWSHFDGRPFNV